MKSERDKKIIEFVSFSRFHLFPWPNLGVHHCLWRPLLDRSCTCLHQPPSPPHWVPLTDRRGLETTAPAAQFPGTDLPSVPGVSDKYLNNHIPPLVASLSKEDFC